MKKHSKLIIVLACIVIGMFGFGFALVPIYNSLCKALNINGKIEQSVVAGAASKWVEVPDRLVTVQFIATNNGGVPWAFYPKTNKITLHPGGMARLAFYAENKTDHTMTVQAIPSVTPAVAARYIKKTECFCFTRQTLNAHEAMVMPLLFHLDNDLPVNVKTMTLAYALFDVTNKS